MDPKIIVALDIVLALAERMTALSGLIRAARSENRSLNETEWRAILDADDQADARLVAEIEKARAEGR